MSEVRGLGSLQGKAHAAGATANLLLLCLSVVLSLVTWFSAAAILPELEAEWGLSEAEVAWMSNSVQIGFVIGALLASFFNLPDIIRLNRLMAGASLLAAAANAVLLLEPGPLPAILCRFVTGIALAGVYPPAMKLTATWFRRNRGLALGAVVGALTLGSAMPHLFRSFVEGFDWQLVITLSSLSCLLAAISFLYFTREGPFPFGRAVFNPKQIGSVLKDRNLFLVNLGYFGHMWELYAMWAWLLVFMRAAMDGALSASMASLLTFVAISAGFLGCIAGGFLSDRIGRTATTAGLMLVSASCALLIGFAFDGPAWLLLLIAIIWGISIVGDSPLFSTAVTELSDPDYVGTALSLQMGIGFGLTVLVIWLTPQMAAFMGGWRWAFLLLVPGPIIGATAMLLLRRSPASVRLAGGKK